MEMKNDVIRLFELNNPIKVPIGDSDDEILEWRGPRVSFRLLMRNGEEVLSVRLEDGTFWNLSEDKVASMSSQDIEDIKWYLDRSTGKVEDHIFKPFGSDGEKQYRVDLNDMTCDCANWRFKCSHHPKENPNRICKHIEDVLRMYPEFTPKAIRELESGGAINKSDDGKVRFPREMFDLYLDDIRKILKGNNIDTFQVCGSYRRLEPMISDLDILVVCSDTAWETLLGQLEAVYGYQLIDQIGRGTAKAAYLIDGWVHVDFKRVTQEQLPFAMLHFTGSKNTNIEMRRVAIKMGYHLNEYGLFDKDDNPVQGDFKDEASIFKFLNLNFKQPWER